MQPYQVVVLLLPTAKQKHDEGAGPIVVVQSQTVIAKDVPQATAKAMKLVPEEHADKDDRLEVWVLPFQRPSSR
jgi:hypothetical protein